VSSRPPSETTDNQHRSTSPLSGLVWSQYLKDHLPLVGVLVVVIVTSWIGLIIWGRLAGPVTEEAGAVIVLEHVDGYVGSQRRGFRHRVRTDSGAENQMTFGELYAVGTRLWVNYRRFTRGTRSR
jgi:hypothetical protein